MEFTSENAWGCTWVLCVWGMEGCQGINLGIGLGNEPMEPVNLLTIFLQKKLGQS